MGGPQDAAPASVPHCTHCGSTSLEESFVYVKTQNGITAVRWYEGLFETSMFGLRNKYQRKRGTVQTYRCQACSHLELFVDVERTW